jgi:MFS family permease
MGALTSSIGTWMQKVAQAWLIVTMTGSRSAFVLGLDSFLGEFPLLLFTMIGGVFADRRDRRQMILMSQNRPDAGGAGASNADLHTAHPHRARARALVHRRVARAFGGPAYQSLIPTLVGREHLPNAIALNSIQFNLAQVIGPFVAGAALAAFGMAACFGLNGISFLFVIAAILALRDMHVPPMATESIVAQIRGGLRFVHGSPNLVTVIALGFFGAFLGMPLLTFLPVVTRDVFHRDAGFYTRLMTFSGLGAVMGALVVAWLGKNRHMGRILLILLMPQPFGP